MTGGNDRAGEAPVPLKTWIAVGGALLGAFLAVLNIQITNTALPYIEGGIATGGIYGTWISTAYLIGEIIVVPLTDFPSRVFSLRRYLLVNTALFLLFSVLCGHAHNLSEMILYRALQGCTSGVLIPLAFTIILSMLPPSKHAMGPAGIVNLIWGEQNESAPDARARGRDRIAPLLCRLGSEDPQRRARDEMAVGR